MPTAASRPRICLIENFADGAAGHWGDNLIRLCDGAVDAGFDPMAVAVHGLHPQVRDGLEATGARIVDRPSGQTARAALWVSRRLRPLHGVLYRLFPKTHLPAQARYVQRCLAEVAALRTATRLGGGGEVVVILTASQGLAATTAQLAGTSHLRFVHYEGAPEGAILRVAERIFARGGRSVVVVCTNPTIEATTRKRHPNRHTVVRPFAVADPAMYIADSERQPARQELAIADTEFVVAMIGGWWPYKDVGTVKRALERVEHPVALVVCGIPIRPAELEPAVKRCGGRIVNLQGSVTERELRRIYAASDCALVTRTPGWPEEIGTIFDAARYGVPLIVSDHDRALSERLSREPWVRLFPTGDASALAKTLDDVADEPPPRPDHGAPERLGLHPASETIVAFCGIAATLPEQRHSADRPARHGKNRC